jgi:hypothetical protein
VIPVLQVIAEIAARAQGKQRKDKRSEPQ